MQKYRQHYWVEILLEWFLKNKRSLPWRIDRTPYKVWISEIMLQQTRVTAVIPYYQRFMDRFPTVELLAAASLEEVYKLWEGLGYYTRAKNIYLSAHIVVEKYQGIFPDTFEDVLRLPGIGDYTAGAIMSFAFNKPFPAVDGNVLRLMSRLTNDFTDVKKPQFAKKVKESLQAVYPLKYARDFTEALMEFGSLVCVPLQPNCFECPLKERCVGYQLGNQNVLPIKKTKAKSLVVKMSVAIIEVGEKVLIVKRAEAGMLANLYGYPIFSVYSKKAFLTELNNFLSTIQIQNDNEVTYKGIVEHEYSHQIWKSKVYFVKINHFGNIEQKRNESLENSCVKDGIQNWEKGEKKWIWVKKTETRRYPISRFFRKVENVVKKKRDRGDSNSRSPA